ncbi:MAG: putative Ig domain-containing protein [Candidatus Manganitrophaceae bacterium]
MNFRIVLSVLILLAALWSFRGKEGPLLQGARETGSPSASFPPPERGNTPPRLTRVAIFPADPDLQSVLRVELQAEDPDRDVLTYRYRWLVNQREVGDQPILPLKGFRQGDLVSVEVIPSDGKAEGTSLPGPAVKIGNHPPVVTTVSLLPPEPKAGQTILAEVEGRDPEGDSVFYDYLWEINGEPVEGVGGNLLDGSRLHSADQVRVIVTPSDSFMAGTSTPSRPIAVINQPPEITSVPPAGIENGQYLYQILAQDPDGDPLEYRLGGGPAGMSIDPASGLLAWKAEPVSDGKAMVAIEVNDKKGGKSVQRFTLETK